MTMKEVGLSVAHMKAMLAGLLIAAFMICLSLTQPANASTSLEPIDEWEKRIAIQERLQSYGPDLLGDKIDPHTGGIVFEHTDVVLPGNSHLEVAVRRRKSQGYLYAESVNTGFADWELLVPKITTLVGAQLGWPAARCTSDHSTTHPNLIWSSTIIQARDYSHGVVLTAGDGGAQQVLRKSTVSNSQWPAAAVHVTTQGWYLKCIANIGSANGGGQGFEAYAPNGDRYRFDRLVSYDHKPMGLLTSSGPLISRKKFELRATEVTDVNGNWVRYVYDASGRLTRIHANDGRSIALAYSGSSQLIASVTANGRTWQYQYQQSTVDDEPIWISGTPAYTGQVLRSVTLPNSRQWSFDLDDMVHEGWPGADCDKPFSNTIGVTHPYGVTGTFRLFEREHRIGRNVRTRMAEGHEQTVQGCGGNFEPPPPGPPPPPKWIAKTMDTISVTNKMLSAPGLADASWTYRYEQDCHTVGPNSNCDDHTSTPFTEHTNSTTVTDPFGNDTVYEHFWPEGVNGLRYGGKLAKLSVYEGDADTGVLKQETTYAYLQEASIGTSFTTNGITNRAADNPTRDAEVTVTRDGDWFKTAYQYDSAFSSPTYSWGAPTLATQTTSTASGSRTVATTYEHNKTRWVLALIDTVTRNGKLFDNATYDSLGRLTRLDRFGALYKTYGYHGSGTQAGALAWAQDALSRRTSFASYKRGVPQLVTRPDATTRSHVIDDNGWLTSATNPRGVTTAYQYNDVGWLTKINRPAPWSDTTIAYAYPASGATQISTRGSARTTTTYDAFLRPALVKTEALSGGGLTSYERWEYDAHGRQTFASLPSTSSNPTAGVDTSYDALERIIQTRETVSPYATTGYAYLSGNRTRVTDPRGYSTTTTLRAYGTPDSGDVVKIEQPEGVTTDMTYDVWGNMLTATQHGGGVSHTQAYFYDSRLRLCRHSVPETGDTLYDYDAADQMTGVARGQAAGTSCAALPSGARVARAYDALGRVDIVNYPGATPDIDIDYDANGNMTRNARGAAVWSYQYDTADQLTEEKLTIDGRIYTTNYLFSADSHLLSQTTPAGRIVSFAPNGLGQATRAEVAGYSYASGLSYHANGSLAGLAYANGHVMTRGLNARQLVETIRVEKPGVKAVDLTYHYGPDGRISEKIDRAGAPVLDPPGVRAIEAEYGPDNRLSRMRDTNAGGAWRTYAYDNRGNVTSDGRLTFAYDAAEQPASMGGAASGAFVYDGNLKRVKQTLAGETLYSVYALSGAILYRDNATTSEATDYIRAAGQTIARLRGGVTTFPHQDHLGSPIAETGLAGAVNWREAYAAYGEKRLDPVGNRDNEGFTGHIDDAASGLTYMQARYYDPVIGRFLSNDPVGFSVDAPQMFNRYAYVLNDPVNLFDPTGKRAETRELEDLGCFSSGAFLICVTVVETVIIPDEGIRPLPGETQDEFVNRVRQACKEACIDQAVEDPDSLPGREMTDKIGRCTHRCEDEVYRNLEDPDEDSGGPGPSDNLEESESNENGRRAEDESDDQDR